MVGPLTPEDLAMMWKESEELRHQLKDEVVYLREEVQKAKDEIKDLEKRVNLLERKKL